MTEKHYGGSTSYGMKQASISQASDELIMQKQTVEDSGVDEKPLTSDEISNYKKAGKIASEAVKFAKSIIKHSMPLLEIAEKIESKIHELGGKPAFPVNLSINEIAAHYTPAFDDKEKAHGLLKVDIGVHVKGCVADTAFSLDLENNEENKKLIEAAELAVKKASEKIRINSELGEIGREIENAIHSFHFLPIQNLSGHAIESYELHAGLTIPNYDNGNLAELEEGAYAIEPFATTGQGIVYDAGKSGIYRLEKEAGVRDAFARKIYNFILEEYKTLPFCERWLNKKFGSRTKLALFFLEKAGILHHYAQLIEKSHAPVSQAEHTILILKNKVEVPTR